MKIEIVHCPTWGNNISKVASLATMIKSRLGIDAAKLPGKTGEFKVIADGETVAERGGNWLTRTFGAGYPELDLVVDRLQAKQQAAGAKK